MTQENSDDGSKRQIVTIEDLRLIHEEAAVALRKGDATRFAEIANCVADAMHGPFAQDCRALWNVWYLQALEEEREFNSPGIIEILLDHDVDVPSVVTRLIRITKRRRGRPRKIRYSPMDAVIAVRGAIRDGHKFLAGDDINKAKDNPAFAAAAEKLGVTPSWVEGAYDKVPEEWRNECRRIFAEFGAEPENQLRAELERLRLRAWFTEGI